VSQAEASNLDKMGKALTANETTPALAFAA
jgi:hypothetical protein